jgi:hypothetical protein
MHWQGTQSQITGGDILFVADVTLASGNATLVLPAQPSRSFLMLQNLGNHPMYVEFGAGTATATLTGTKVTSISVVNGGFNFTSPPIVRLMGGGPSASGNGKPYLGLNQPNGQNPSHVALAHATLSGGAVNAFVVDDQGSGYLIAPYVLLLNSDLDPYGCATPSATSGITLPASQTAPIKFDGSFCPTGPVAVIGTSGDTLLCRWCW